MLAINDVRLDGAKRNACSLSTKIPVTVDALGNSTGLSLTPGQAHALKGDDVLLKDTPGAAAIADKASDTHA